MITHFFRICFTASLLLPLVVSVTEKETCRFKYNGGGTDYSKSTECVRCGPSGVGNVSWSCNNTLFVVTYDSGCKLCLDDEDCDTRNTYCSVGSNCLGECKPTKTGKILATVAIVCAVVGGCCFAAVCMCLQVRRNRHKNQSNTSQSEVQLGTQPQPHIYTGTAVKRNDIVPYGVPVTQGQPSPIDLQYQYQQQYQQQQQYQYQQQCQQQQQYQQYQQQQQQQYGVPVI
jgi:hypothetical protein